MMCTITSYNAMHKRKNRLEVVVKQLEEDLEENYVFV